MFGHQNKLQNLSLRHVYRQILNICLELTKRASRSSEEEMISFVKEAVKPYYINLSTYLRYEIIKKNMVTLHCDELVNVDMEVYLVAILLDHNIKHIKFNQYDCVTCSTRNVECSHLKFLLKLLASEGVELKSLQLNQWSLDREKDLLHQALLNMKNLSHLTLGNTATDDILKIIGKSCAKFVMLDIADSPVTNIGLMYLFLKQELQDVCPLSYGKRLSWSRFRLLLATQDEKRKSGKKEEQKNKTSLCDTLEVLKINGTGITVDGGILTLLCIPQLTSLGKWSNTVAVIKAMDEITQFKFRYNITEVADIKTCVDNLCILALRCPKMNKLYISEPFHSPDALRIVSNIVCLNISDMSTEWMKDFYNYLRTNGQNLHELKLWEENPVLKPFPSDELVVNLREILDYCPNLRILSLVISNIIWTQGHDPSPLRYLRKIRFQFLADALAIVKILSLAPKLEVIYIYFCYNLTEYLDEYLEKSLTNISESNNQKLDMCYNSLQNLRYFYVQGVYKVSTSTARNILNACKRLEVLGNIWKWNFGQKDRQKDREYKCILISAYPNIHFWKK